MPICGYDFTGYICGQSEGHDLNTVPHLTLDAGCVFHDLKSEIYRHHRDFEKISKLLDDWNKYGGVCGDYTLSILKQIRNIVG